jgi:ABC-type transport system involved in cytochrome c biogenesis ATPase subunit
VLGHDLRRDRRARSLRRRLALLGHAGGLYDDLTVAEQARWSARSVGRPGDAATAALARLGLDGRLAGVPVARLSAGQRRRLALACLLVRDAELWLLDEPHAGLDAPGRDVLDAAVAETATAGGTVVIASHELERAGPLAHRSLAMGGGRLREVERVA